MQIKYLWFRPSIAGEIIILNAHQSVLVAKNVCARLHEMHVAPAQACKLPLHVTSKTEKLADTQGTPYLGIFEDLKSHD